MMKRFAEIGIWQRLGCIGKLQTGLGEMFFAFLSLLINNVGVFINLNEGEI